MSPLYAPRNLCLVVSFPDTHCPCKTESLESGVQILGLLLCPPQYLEVLCTPTTSGSFFLIPQSSANRAERSWYSNCTGGTCPELESWKEPDVVSTAGILTQALPGSSCVTGSLLALSGFTIFPDLVKAVVKGRVWLPFCYDGPS